MSARKERLQEFHALRPIGQFNDRYAMRTQLFIKKEKQIEWWFSVVCTLIDNDTRHHSGQNVVDSRGAAE